MINAFTPVQMSSIASSYELMAKTLTEFQLIRWSEFTHEQQLDLNAYQNSLLNRAHDLQTRAINPDIDRAEWLTETIQQTIDHTRNRLLLTGDLSIALALGALTVALAACVARANKKGMQSAFNELNYLLETGNA